MKNPPHPMPLPAGVNAATDRRSNADRLAEADRANRKRLAGPSYPPPPACAITLSNGQKSWKAPPGGSA
jgi:hypothetical protein